MCRLTLRLRDGEMSDESNRSKRRSSDAVRKQSNGALNPERMLAEGVGLFNYRSGEGKTPTARDSCCESQFFLTPQTVRLTLFLRHAV